MFCARCGQQIPDLTAICPLCGREANLHLEPRPDTGASITQNLQVPVSWAEEPEAALPPVRRPELKGVDGWLLFFCVSLVVFAPIRILANGLSESFYHGNTTDLVLVGYGMLVGGFVWTAHRSAFVFLWIYFGVTLVLSLLAIAGYAVSPQPRPEAVLQIVRGLIVTLIWFWYFKRSDRVQATFGRNL